MRRRGIRCDVQFYKITVKLPFPCEYSHNNLNFLSVSLPSTSFSAGICSSHRKLSRERGSYPQGRVR